MRYPKIQLNYLCHKYYKNFCECDYKEIKDAIKCDIKNDYNHETNNRAKKYIPILWVNFLADAKTDVG